MRSCGSTSSQANQICNSSCGSTSSCLGWDQLTASMAGEHIIRDSPAHGSIVMEVAKKPKHLSFSDIGISQQAPVLVPCPFLWPAAQHEDEAGTVAPPPVA